MAKSRIRPQRIRLLGEPVDLVNPAEVMSFTARRIVEGRAAIVANHNTHSLYLLPRHPEMRAFYERADLVELDSAPLVLWGKLTRKPVSRRHRCTYLDWQGEFWRLASAKGWRVFYLGGAPGVADLAAENIRARHPGAVVDGRHGYFDIEPGSAENTAAIEAINAFRPDVLFVGMGMPRQERWIAENADALTHPAVVFSVGAAFDYEAGVQAAAPRWLGRMGLEWAFRLAADPRRLFTRYLVEPWTLGPQALADLKLAYAPRPKSSAAMEPARPEPLA